MAGCPICGAPHKSCGAAATTTGIKFMRREETMSTLKRYEVDLGRGKSAILQLSDEDAKLYGDSAKLAGKAQPNNKAAQPQSNKASKKSK